VSQPAWSVVDLFSGAGGMSYGFSAYPGFRVAGAADAQMGKPSTGPGRLGCNESYYANIGVEPVDADLATASPVGVCEAMNLRDSRVTVLSACPPCTGFSRALAHNHLRDDARNNLVRGVARYVEELRPEIVLMENARELIMGRFSEHLRGLLDDLQGLGYRASASVHFLNDCGLPQRRERALVVAVRRGLPLRTLADLWSGWQIDTKATHVRRAIWELPAVLAGQADPQDPMHVSPVLRSELTRRRLAVTPADGGGWADLAGHPDAGELLTPSMKHRVAARDFGSHPDVYGRLWWDRPAVTIKRECAHVGNGRYAHPSQDRLCTVREMAILQGFPRGYQFAGSLANMYRHVGDAVPPLISFQLAGLCRWILTGQRPPAEQIVLPGLHLVPGDIEPVSVS
jgi:DNA (cytosine-5)-methyltransferase 1